MHTDLASLASDTRESRIVRAPERKDRTDAPTTVVTEFAAMIGPAIVLSMTGSEAAALVSVATGTADESDREWVRDLILDLASAAYGPEYVSIAERALTI